MTGTVGLIARREVSERLRARSWQVSTALLVVVILAIGVIVRVGGDDGPATVEVAYAGPAHEQVAAAVEAVAAQAGREAETVPFDGEGDARRAVEDGDADVALLADRGRLLFASGVDEVVRAIVQQAWSAVETRRALTDAGLDEATIEAALSPGTLDAGTVDGGDDIHGSAALAGSLAAILLFLSLQTFGNYVLSGVVEEKSTAVVELLLVRARADQLLAGKVAGIGLAALGQFALAVAAGMGALALSGVDIPGELWSALPLTLVWFAGGYALYATLFALAGSLVSRQEDAQAAAAPVMYTLVGGYLLVFVFGYVPDSTIATVLSLVPPVTPFLMPMRMAAGAASGLEVAAAAVLLLGATLAAWKLAASIYEHVLLHRGARIGWRRAVALRRGA